MVLEDLREGIRSDLERYCDKPVKNLNRVFWNNGGFQYSFYQRHCYYFQYRSSLNYKLRFAFYNFLQKLLGQRYRYHIDHRVKFGNGLLIAEPGPITICNGAMFGNNVELNSGLVIADDPVSGNAPKFGNGIWIGRNVTISGDIYVGNNVIIEADTKVNFDVPDNSIVMGDPASVSTLSEANPKLTKPLKHELYAKTWLELLGPNPSKNEN